MSRGEGKLINAERRGVIAGSEEANKLAKQVHLLNEYEISTLANQVFDSMQQRGYAHIEPREDFVRGFSQGFKYARMWHQI